MINKVIAVVFIIFFINFKADAGSSRLIDLETKINQLRQDQVELLNEKSQLEPRIKAIEQKIYWQKKQLVKRLISIEKLQKNNWLDFFSTEISNLKINLKILKKLSDNDKNLLIILKNDIENLKNSQKNLTETEALIAKNILDLKNTENDIIKLDDEAEVVLKKKLNKPSLGILVQAFGYRTDKSKLFNYLSNGETYSCQRSKDVYAVSLGKVVFLDVMPGWGKTIVVEHANNYYTVYAGVKTSKLIGDSVVKNEKIGNCLGSNLYFELRHFANTLNPTSWYAE